MFTVINAVLLRPLPYREPGQLVQIRKQTPPGGAPAIGAGDIVSDREFFAWKQQSRSLAQLAAFSGGAVNLSGVDQAERLMCGEVSHTFFPLLGVQPLMGRGFSADEDRPGGAPVVVLSHALWQRRFGSNPAVIHQSITLDGKSHSIVGVLPPSFQFPEPFELWRPLGLSEAAADLPEGAVSLRLLRVLGRLKPDATLARAQAELEVINRRLMPSSPTPGAGPIQLPFPAGAMPGQTRSPVLAGTAGDAFDLPMPPERVPTISGPAPPGPDGVPSESQFRELAPPPGDVGPVDQLQALPPGAGPLPGVGAPPTAADSGTGLPLFGPGGLVRLVSLHEQVVGNVRPALLVLFGAVGLVLVIACANVANLLLARAGHRRREMAVRAALGAGRWRIVRQLLSESVVLGLLAGGLGLAFSIWGISVLRLASTTSLPQLNPIRLDGWVLAFTLAVSVATSLVFGLVPALQASRPNLNEGLKDTGHGAGGAQGRRSGHLLVAGEIALALVLLSGAGLLLKSFVRLRAVDPGFQTAGVLTTTIQLTPSVYPSAERQRGYFSRLLERVQSLPGVEAAGLTDHLPLTDYSIMMMVQIEGMPPVNPSRNPVVSGATVSADYFRAMGIPLKRGRVFTEGDGANASAVALVNEAFVRRFLPDVDPIGRRVSSPLSAGGWATIVGVVGDVRQSGLESEVVPEVYGPFLQQASGMMTLAVRSSGDPRALATAVRGIARELDPDQPLQALMTMEQRLSATTAPRRLTLGLLGTFAALALVLASVGIYGVMSFVVVQRTREIGIRMALGASRGEVLGLVLRQGLAVTLWGLLAGGLGTWVLTRYLASLLFAVSPADLPTLLGASLLLGAIALLACLLPAWRAARVDPMRALRNE
jgi:cell division protein FtsX